MDEQEVLRHKLADLESEHRDLDQVILRLTESVPFDQLQVQRLKKRKLVLRDQIEHIRTNLIPDDIA